MHRSNILLLIILLLFIAAIISGVFFIRSEKLAIQLETDRPINTLIIFEFEGKPISSQLLMFYATKSKAALLDIPANTAVILKTIKRMDRVDFIYRTGAPKNYITEISSYLDIPVHGYLLFNEKSLSKFVDLLDGLQLFIPTMILQPGPPHVRLPGGAVTLDGEKVQQYLRYSEEGESEGDILARRQRLSIALLKKISEKASLFQTRKMAFPIVDSIQSNFGAETKMRLFKEMAVLDADSILLQKITGMYRSVEGQPLFFPFYDGELARDMLKQTLNAMSTSENSQSTGRIFTVEILNGTTERGLASRTAEIFESFGYDVVSIGNAANLDYSKTVVIDRYGDKEALTAIASVIKCDSYADSSIYRGTIKADFTIILGKDFNGRICVR
jgi:anionic cell wall polymer biosynthesis LytR-Cps2A-Psr (LCP) family protein